MPNNKDNIKLFALGGLGENGKNMYVVEVNNDIFILDAGLKYPSVDLLGVDAVIPDFSYLNDNRKRIKGLFLSHGHEDHIGAVPHLLSEINIPVYGTKLTLALVKDMLNDFNMDISDLKMNTITPHSKLKFNKTLVSFFSTTHSIPESIAICIHTSEGVIVYTSDYTFDQNVDLRYRTSFDLISDISRKGVLCLLSESLGAENPGHTSTENMLRHELTEAFSKADKRVIVSLFSSDIQRIQKVIDTAEICNRKLAIIGRRTQRTVDIAVRMGYLRVPKNMLVNLKYIDERNNNNKPNYTVLVTGNRNEPYDALVRMTRKVDRLVHIEPTDTIILATPPVPGTEKTAARTKDLLHRSNAKVISISKNLLPLSHASVEDIKLMINLLKPKYVIPVTGEYRHQYAQAKIADQIGFDSDKIILLDNGQVVNISEGEIQNYTDFIDVDQILLDGHSLGDVSNVVLRDRVLLSQDGILLVIGNICTKTKQLVAGPEVITRGFIYVKDSEEIIKGVSTKFKDIVDSTDKTKFLDINKMRNDIRDKVSKYLYKETKRKPIVIVIIIEV